MIDEIQKNLLREIADLHGIPTGAYNIRANGDSAGRVTTNNIDIVTKQDKQGIDIYIKAGTKNESIHIPVIISESGLSEVVYNDFYIGEDADVTIIAGCGIHNDNADGTGDCGNDRRNGCNWFGCCYNIAVSDRSYYVYYGHDHSASGISWKCFLWRCQS